MENSAPLVECVSFGERPISARQRQKMKKNALDQAWERQTRHYLSNFDQNAPPIILEGDDHSNQHAEKRLKKNEPPEQTKTAIYPLTQQ